MAYTGGGPPPNLQYSSTIPSLNQQLTQLSVGTNHHVTPGQGGYGGGAQDCIPQNITTDRSYSQFSSQTLQVQQQQQPHFLQQQSQHLNLSPSSLSLKNQTLLSVSPISTPKHHLSPNPLGAPSPQSQHATPIHSNHSSPIRSALGTAQLSSSLSPRLHDGTSSSAGQTYSVSPSLTPHSPIHTLGGAQLASSFPPLLQPQDGSFSSAFTPQPPLQSSLAGTQLGSSWSTTESHIMGYNVPNEEKVNEVGRAAAAPSFPGPNPYNAFLLNGQMGTPGVQVQQEIHYQGQLSFPNASYSTTEQQQQQQQQQQQFQYNFSQMQPFPQEGQNFQFNVDYVSSCDANAYQDYYYDGYQYNGSYSGSIESLDASYGTTPQVRAPTPYGDETVEDLGPEEVRWFYKVEADKKWTPFIGYDSLRIEYKYQDLLQDPIPGEAENESDSAASEKLSPKEKQEEEKSKVVERIVVRGGLYEVDVKLRKCESIYWQGEVFVISRGTWFYDAAWGPVEEMLSDRIEVEHLTHFRGHLLSSQRIDDSTKEVVHSLSLPEGQVDWFSASEVYLSSDATPSRLMRSVGKKLGFQKTGYKLHRGYSIDATASDKPPDINHIVFVIHGIGQKMETGRIIKNCTGLRENINFLKQKYFPSVAKSSQTVEFFPVEWRSSLVLDAGVIESITPHKILNIRQMLNASFMDIMYYNSPLYRKEIITGLTGEMNRLYTIFTQRNPYFEANGGKVSIVAHSLGCVITYDIVTGWNPAKQFDQQLIQSLLTCLEKDEKINKRSEASLKSGLKSLLESHETDSSQPSLNFKIENFFCLGSPLAVFLALRTKQSQDEPPDIIPQNLCKRLLNVFHPADPVAYRIEPLLCSQYSSIAPVLIHSYNVADKIPYSEMPLEPIIVTREKDNRDCRDTGDRSRADSGNNTPVSSAPSTPVKGAASTWSWWGLMKGNKKTTDSSNQDTASALQDVRGLMERIDFVLREGSMENSYISALTSHTSYWTNYDVSHFMLSILYPDIQPTSSKPENAKS